MHFAQRVDYRNNAFMGAAGPERRGDPRKVVDVVGGPGEILSHNAHRIDPRDAQVFHIGPRDAGEVFDGLEKMAAATGFGAHSIAVPDYRVFVDAPEPDHTVHKKDSPLVPFESVDLRLARGSSLIDAGCVIPNVNGDFVGAAPDIGAYEAGRPLPHYGPRTAVACPQ